METIAKNIIDLDKAVTDIAYALKDSHEAADEKGDSKRKLFFFMVGGGISSPSIKMASEIIADCKQKAIDEDRAIENPALDVPTAYSQWFEAAYPHRSQRKDYLEEIISKRPITEANFRLAHLLQESAITNIVVTSNFDQLLELSLNILGEPYIIADTSRTVDRVDPEAKAVQIIHVHGTYRYYDLQNTVSEIDRQSRLEQDSPITMAALLDSLLVYQVPIVIGYGGWKDDVFMTALHRRLQRPLPYNLYWFCYESSVITTLPLWLRNHPDVFFVCSNGETNKISSGLATSVSTSTAKLEAKVVFERLEQELKLVNQLISNPLQHFKNQLVKLMPPLDEKSEDINATLNAVVDRLNRAVENDKQINNRFDAVRSAVETKDYRSAIDRTNALDKGELISQQRIELMQLMTKELDNSSVDARRLHCEMAAVVLKNYDLLLEEDVSITSIMKRQASAASNNIGNLFLDIDKQYDKAMQYYDQSLSLCKDETDIWFQTQVGHVLNNKGIALRVTGDCKKAIEEHDNAIAQFSARTEDIFKNITYRAHVFKGMCLNILLDYNNAKSELDKAKQVLDSINDKIPSTVRDIELMEQAVTKSDEGLKVEAEKSITDAPAQDVATNT